jgi:hypothetical protein
MTPPLTDYVTTPPAAPRYSHLTHEFGRLLHESRLSEKELRGLREDKLKSIRSFAKFLAEDAA